MNAPIINFNNEKHTITFGDGEIDENGQLIIADYLYNSTGFTLPDWWQWTNVVARGKYSGTFVKRVRKYLNERGYKLTQAQCSELGSLIGENCESNKEYHFRFTKKDWQDGDFADGGSCYWNSRFFCREIIKSNGGGAIQFFTNNEETEYGIGRAWLIKSKICKDNQNDWIVFNGYGLTTLKIARILSQYLGLSYRRVKLCNQFKQLNDENSNFYINSGNGIVLCQDPSVYGDLFGERPIVNLGINTLNYIDNCKFCQRWLFKQELNNKICKNCHGGETTCSRCHGPAHQDYLRFDSPQYPDGVCQDCWATAIFCYKCKCIKFCRIENINHWPTRFCLDCGTKEGHS